MVFSATSVAQDDSMSTAASLVLQAGTAAMVMYMLYNQNKDESSDDSDDKTTTKKKVLDVSKDEKRSIRGENVYGPYKKVRKLYSILEI